ncbi:hypothetical protein FB451DRAFT_1555624 [Mycena latifolia]|nr:hypothetical protein FB451DRAFT_1555624 [Mycena latifolia]
MHPAVVIRNMQRLPAPQRRVALAACGSSRSLQNLQRVEKLVEVASAPQKILFLPVFYSNLDPAQIPTPADLESLQPDTITRIACASRSLKAIIDLFIDLKPPEDEALGPTLWPRIWPWVYFLHEHRDHLPAASILPEAAICTQFLIFAANISGSMSATISSSAGFRIILAKSWGFLRELDSAMPGFESCLRYIGTFIANLDFADPVHFTEMVDGAGGTMDDLARLVMQYIDVLVVGHLPFEAGTPGVYIRSLVSFIQGGRRADPSHKSTSQGSPLPPLQEKFLQTLRHHDFIPALVVEMNSLLVLPPFPRESPASAQIGREDTENSLRATFELLERLLNTPRGYRWLPGAIKAGLLRVMASVAIAFGPALDSNLRVLLTKYLPDGLVYYHVIVAIDEALDDITEFCSSEEFDALDISDDWLTFLYRVEDRVKLMRRLDGLRLSRACDNLECGKMQDRSDFRRCSGCKSSYYCSTECQMADWKRGGHRNHCGSRSTLSLADTSSCLLDFHERKFIRALVQEEYETQITKLCKAQVTFMNRGNHGHRFFTLFDYTCEPVQISIDCVVASPMAAALKDAGPEWTHLIERLAESKGRIQLHVIRVPHGSDVRFWVVPLRTNSPQLHDALQAFAESSSADDHEAVADGVQSILENTSDRVEIH